MERTICESRVEQSGMQPVEVVPVRSELRPGKGSEEWKKVRALIREVELTDLWGRWQ
jgi:hypothetical protein